VHFSEHNPPPPRAGSPAGIFLFPCGFPHLYRFFFYFHDDFNRWLEAQKVGKTPAQIQALDRDVGNYFRLNTADLIALRSVSLAFAAELRAQDAAERTHSNERARFEQPPLRARVEDIENNRRRIVDRGIAELRARLSAAGWSSFRQYINGRHRNMYKIVSR
jgi:hypothetical protein